MDAKVFEVTRALGSCHAVGRVFWVLLVRVLLGCVMKLLVCFGYCYVVARIFF